MQFPWVPVPLVGVKLSFKGEVVISIDGKDFVVNLVRQNADSMAEVALALDHVTITLRGPRHVRNFPGIFRAKVSITSHSCTCYTRLILGLYQ